MPSLTTRFLVRKIVARLTLLLVVQLVRFHVEITNVKTYLTLTQFSLGL